MRREVPLFLAAFFGFFVIADLFINWEAVPSETLRLASRELKVWANILIAFAYVLGAGNVLRIHGGRILRQQTDWIYSLVVVVSMLVMLVFGFANSKSGGVFSWLYTAMYSPMQATMFSLLAFYIASAAFRAFRIRSIQASLLAITAMIVMLGSVPIGAALWDGFPEMRDWMMKNLQTAGKRAILIGAGLGIVSTGLKMITGIERTFLSGE